MLPLAVEETVPNVPLPYAESLEREALPYKDDIIAAIRKIL